MITGASSGLGYDLARLFAREGHDLVLVARGREALEKLAEECRREHGVKVEVIVKDLGLTGAAGEIVEKLGRRGIEVEFLVNNAGFGTQGRFWESDLGEELRMIQVNVVALMALTRLLLPRMVERRRGRILNVASMAGFVPGPYMSTYYATKAYVLSQSVAWWRELRRKGVSVTALCPGPTRTAFQRRAGMKEASLFQGDVMESATVARIGYQGMMRGKAVVIPGWRNKVLGFLSRWPPRTVLAGITGRLNRDRQA